MFAQLPTLPLPDIMPWLRGLATVDGEWLVLDRDRAEEYFPAEERGYRTFLDLLLVRTPKDAASYVQAHGLLRHGLGADEHRERFADFEFEAFNLKTIVYAYMLLQEAERGKADAIPKIRDTFARFLGESFQNPDQDDETLLAQLGVEIAANISAGLHQSPAAINAVGAGGVLARLASPKYPHQFIWSIRTPDLLAYAYYQFAVTTAANVPFSTCQSCGSLFMVEDARQKYCSPRCSQRARFQRWAKKNRPKKTKA